MNTIPLTNIFGESMPPKLILEEPPSETKESMANMLIGRCNKQTLLRYAETFVPWLSQYSEIFLITRNGKTRQATEITLMVKSSTSKNDMALGVATMLASQQNMLDYIDSLSEEMKTLWRTLLLKNYLSHATAKKILKTKDNLFSEQRSYYYYSSGEIVWNKRELGWFYTTYHYSAEKDKYGYREKQNYITLSNTVRGIFFPLFFQQMLIEGSHTTAELPKGKWHTVELEADSQSHFKLLSSLIKQGEFTMRKNGITQADVKRVNKKLSIKDFFDNDDDNPQQQNMRASFYIQVMVLNEMQKGNNKKSINTYEDTLKELFAKFDRLDKYLTAIIFPHIKGLGKTFTEWNHLPQLCMRMLQWMLTEPTQWVPIVDIFFHITWLDSNGSKSFINTEVFAQTYPKNTSEVVNEITHQYITVDQYTEEFGLTALKSFAYLLCSLGMAEIAVNENKIKNTPFSNLEYLRLTPLGCYVLGTDQEYEPPQMEHVAYFELDPDRLIIRSLVEPNPYAQLLMDTSVPISTNRFQTSAMSFLANCRTRNDVESKINIFRQFIADELPPLWQRFFMQLLQHCHPLMEDRTSYQHYTLKPDNTELIELVTTDPVLRSIVIRAEGYRLLVKTVDIRKFEIQLKKHGYLL